MESANVQQPIDDMKAHIERGDKLTILEDHTEHLAIDSKQFAKQAKILKTKMKNKSKHWYQL